MEKIPHHSHDTIRDNFEKIQKLFPSVVDEVKDENGNIKKELNIDELKKLFDNKYNENPIERYSLNWPGKRRSLIRANTPLTDTLRPARDESVDFDTTKNLYIEGDNFAVLKTLQHAYMGKVKMIYIDPPYNTGKDFVYNDNFTEDMASYREKTGETVDGVQMEKNTDTNGRFHSDWLSMMYERLIVARDLLTDDGVIFMSIDDNEVHNLRKLADEVFGEENFVAEIIWMKGKEGGNDNDGMGKHHEYILMYGKTKEASKSIILDKKDKTRHINALNEENLVIAGEEIYKDGEPFQLINLSKQKDYKLTIPLKNGEILQWEGYCPQKTLDEYIRIGKIFVGSNRTPYVKSFLSDEKEGTKPSTLFEQNAGTTKSGGIEFKKIFDEQKFFSYPKPSSLIYRLISLVSEDDDIILDFFSGSGTTAQAVIQKNTDDGKNRKFILVQIPEIIEELGDPKEKEMSKNAKNFLTSIGKPHNICEIGKERIRRAAAKIRTDFASQIAERETPLDTGFRVYKLDSTCRADNELHPFDTTQMNIEGNISAFKSDRSAEDILTEILLREGQMLSGEIVSKKVGENTIYIIDGGIVACLDKTMSHGLVDAIIAENPHTIIFSDEIFGGSDSLKINTENTIETAFGKGNVMIKVF